MAKYLVPWSGGLDSTALIDFLLSEGHTVDALYTNINNNKQDTRQLIAVRKMHKQYFNGKNLRLIETGGIKTNGFKGINSHTPVGLTQVVYHIFNIINNISDHDYVALGYVMNDDAISYLEEIKVIYNSYNGICWGKMPELIFPLAKMKKRDLYSKLPEVLRKNITWCESEVKNKCGTCPSCERMKGLI